MIGRNMKSKSRRWITKNGRSSSMRRSRRRKRRKRKGRRIRRRIKEE